MMAIGLALLAAVGFGSASVFARSGLQGLPLLPTIWLSLLVSFVLSSILVLVFAFDDIGTLSQVAILWIVALGAAQYFGGRSQNYMAIGIIGASRASLFFATQAPFAALLAFAFIGESLSIPRALGTVAVVVGLFAASGDSLLEGWRTDKRYLLGYLVALGAGAAYGGTNVMVKITTDVYDSPLVITAMSMLVGLVLLAPAVGFKAIGEKPVQVMGRRHLQAVAMAGISAGVGTNALYFALQRADVVVVTPIVASSPLVTLLLAHLFISRLEKVTLRLTAGAILTVAGVIMVTLGGRM